MADRGSFWLGNLLDPTTGDAGPDHLALGSADLTTHGVVVGMTGSGKTGLGVVLIEEAFVAGIPVLVLDPKGDMGNLALTFPALEPASFRPWVNESDAQAEGITPDELAVRTATIWRQGLERQGSGGARGPGARGGRGAERGGCVTSTSSPRRRSAPRSRSGSTRLSRRRRSPPGGPASRSTC